MSLRFTPTTSTSPNASTLPGTHPEYLVRDQLRFGFHTLKSHHQQTNPLQNSIQSAEALAFQRKLTLQRNLYGLHAPIRLQMEIQLLSNLKQAPLCFKSNNLALDVVMGNDCMIDVEDILGDRDDHVDTIDFHSAMESKLNIL